MALLYCIAPSILSGTGVGFKILSTDFRGFDSRDGTSYFIEKGGYSRSSSELESSAKWLRSCASNEVFLNIRRFSCSSVRQCRIKSLISFFFFLYFFTPSSGSVSLPPPPPPLPNSSPPCSDSEECSPSVSLAGVFGFTAAAWLKSLFEV